MRKMPSVNDLIWTHFCCGGMTASLIRSHVENWKDCDYLNVLGGFFDAEDDTERFDYAHAAARIFLRRVDMDYLLPLWQAVKRLEDQRKIPYEKQTDHAVHSMYMYLLGIWFFDNSQEFQKEYARFFVSRHDRRDISRIFALQWTFAGLLHDLGYVFGAMTTGSGAVEDHPLHTVQKFFTKDGMKWRFPYVRPVVRDSIWVNATSRIADWRAQSLFPSYSTARTPLDVLREVNKVPWLPELTDGAPTTVTEMFDQCSFPGMTGNSRKVRPTGSRLLCFAEQIAKAGYGDQVSGMVDHAFASGCLLFQLSSFKYWLALRCGAGHEDELGGSRDPNRFPYFSYHANFLSSTILPACHAAAAHNVCAYVPLGRRLLPIRLRHSPLLFLSILLDELQKWHRAAVGSAYIAGEKPYLRPKERDIYFEVISYRNWERICINCAPNKIYEDIYEKLNRLDYSEIGKFICFLGHGGKLNLNRRILEILTKLEK
jgi:hypothetical protein